MVENERVAMARHATRRFQPNLDAAFPENDILLPTFIPTIGSQSVPSRLAASHSEMCTASMSSQIGMLKDALGRGEILLVSLIMLRSWLQIHLAQLANGIAAAVGENSVRAPFQLCKLGRERRTGPDCHIVMRWLAE
jgi:hypothetical protein